METELENLTSCFVCGLPLTSDDFKCHDAGATGAHKDCYEKWQDQELYKLERGYR